MLKTFVETKEIHLIGFFKFHLKDFYAPSFLLKNPTLDEKLACPEKWPPRDEPLWQESLFNYVSFF